VVVHDRASAAYTPKEVQFIVEFRHITVPDIMKLHVVMLYQLVMRFHPLVQKAHDKKSSCNDVVQPLLQDNVNVHAVI
jgi:hypothetical protein